MFEFEEWVRGFARDESQDDMYIADKLSRRPVNGSVGRRILPVTGGYRHGLGAVSAAAKSRAETMQRARKERARQRAGMPQAVATNRDFDAPSHAGGGDPSLGPAGPQTEAQVLDGGPTLGSARSDDDAALTADGLRAGAVVEREV